MYSISAFALMIILWIGVFAAILYDFCKIYRRMRIEELL